MEKSESNFQGIWIPRAIYLSTEVNWCAKILFLEIHSFTENGRECYMSNKHIASILHISERQVSRYITELKAKGWMEETGFNGRKRHLKSLLQLRVKTGQTGRMERSGLPGQDRRGSPDKSVQHTKQVIKENKKQFTFLNEEKENRSPVLE